MSFLARSLRVLLFLALLTALPVSIALVVPPTPRAAAHPGGLDSSGCHTCRTNCTERYGIPYGDYHCHGGGSSGGGSGGGSSSPAPSPPPPPPPPPPDTAPPAPPALSGAATVDTGQAKMLLAAEAGSTLRCASETGGEHYVAEATGSPQEVAFEVPVGDHDVNCVATDGAGNASAPYSTRVSYPAPATPQLRHDRTNRNAPLVVLINGATGTTATVQLSNGAAQSVALPAGAAEVLFDVDDGDYTVQGFVTDRRGTPSGAASIPATVDTTAPKLRIAVKKKPARDGKLVFVVHTDPGADVVVRTKGTKLKADYTAKTKPRRFEKAIDSGRYVVTVNATDDNANTTTQQATIRIAQT